MRDAARYGRKAAAARQMDGMQLTFSEPVDEGGIKVYRDAERFLDGLVGIFGLKRKHLLDADGVRTTMRQGVTHLVLPNDYRYLLYRSDGHYGILRVRHGYDERTIKRFIAAVERGTNHVRSQD